jgi:fatty acid desaturase
MKRSSAPRSEMNRTSDTRMGEQYDAPPDRYGWAAVLRNALPYFALLAIAPFLQARSAWLPWSLAPLVGLFAYRMTIVMHDCTHRTLFANPQLNVRIGKALGAITGIDFNRFSAQHWLHHRIYGEAGDPQGFHYADLQWMTRAGLLWRLAKPLFGLNVRHTWSESFLDPRNLIRTLRTGEALLILPIQTLIAVLVTGAGAYWSLVLLPLASTATFGLFFSQLRGVAEHGTIDSTEAGFVRSHAPHWLDRLLLYDLHFNYHAEHHRHPQCSSYHLPAMHRASGDAAPKPPRSMFHTIAMLMSRRSNHA